MILLSRSFTYATILLSFVAHIFVISLNADFDQTLEKYDSKIWTKILSDVQRLLVSLVRISNASASCFITRWYDPTCPYLISVGFDSILFMFEHRSNFAIDFSGRIILTPLDSDERIFAKRSLSSSRFQMMLIGIPSVDEAKSIAL